MDWICGTLLSTSATVARPDRSRSSWTERDEFRAYRRLAADAGAGDCEFTQEGGIRVGGRLVGGRLAGPRVLWGGGVLQDADRAAADEFIA
jgi:hypothetical protein